MLGTCPGNPLGFPNMQQGQVYVVKRADSSHYQGQFWGFIQALKTFDGDVSVKIYHPQQDYSNSFLVVLNEPASTAPFLTRVDWMTVRVAIHARGKNVTPNASSPVKRQSRKCLDLGFTSAMRISRKNSVNGVPKPLLKPGTTDPDVVDCFLVLSDIVRSVNIPWLMEHNLEPFVDMEYPERQETFAGSIHPDNLTEALRAQETSVDELCGCHLDKHNSKKESMAIVVGLNTILGQK
jgi:hypothetical protein